MSHVKTLPDPELVVKTVNRPSAEGLQSPTGNAAQETCREAKERSASKVPPQGGRQNPESGKSSPATTPQIQRARSAASLGTYTAAIIGRGDDNSERSEWIADRIDKERLLRFKRRETSQNWLISDARKQANFQPGDDWLKLPKTHQCGRRIAENISLVVKTNGSVTINGVQLCASAWACPFCTPYIRHMRGKEIQGLIDQHLDSGGWGVFISATLRHKKSDSLASMLPVLSKAWSNLMGQRKFKEFTKNRVGTIRCLEVMDGKNGWHPHLHILLLTPDEWESEKSGKFVKWVKEQWVFEVAKLAPDFTPSVKIGVDVRPFTKDGKVVAEYLAKTGYHGWNIGTELTRFDLKKNRSGKGVNPFQLLDVDSEDSRLRWLEYVNTIRGRSSLHFSPGLRAKFDLSAPLSDEAALVEAIHVFEDSNLLSVEPQIVSQIARLTRQGRIDDARNIITSTARFQMEYAEDALAESDSQYFRDVAEYLPPESATRIMFTRIADLIDDKDTVEASVLISVLKNAPIRYEKISTSVSI